MDDDLQHPPEEIPKLLNMLCSGYDVVYGRPDGSYWERFPDSHTPAWYSPMGAKPDPAVDREYFITNPDPDYNHFGMVGTWYRTAITLENTGGALGLDYRYTNPGSGSRKAIFTFYVRDAGMYAVLATWQAQPQNASNAQFTINHSGFYGGPSPTVVEVDQRVTSPYLINQLGAFYFTPGTNTIELSDLANGVVVADLVALMPLGNPSSLLRAEFGADVVAGSGPLAVQFTDASFTYGDGALFLEDPAIAAWEWDFGDGTTSGEQNPLHTYAEPGLYTVSLTITDEGGAQSTETREEFIAVDTPPALQAEFMADTLYGSTQTLVRFQDQSSGEIASWHWDFGDGVTSAERNPQHVFRSTGTFTVTLTVTGPSGSDTRVKEDYIYNMTPWLIVDNTFEYKPHYYSTYRGRDIGVVIMDASGINLKSEELKYSRFFYNSCFTGKYFLNTFNRGVVFFTHANSREPRPEGVYIRRYLEGYSDEEIKGFLNALNYEEDENSVQFGLYDYYDFTKPPPSMR
jgi:PKD repeat protein